MSIAGDMTDGGPAQRLPAWWRSDDFVRRFHREHRERSGRIIDDAEKASARIPYVVLIPSLAEKRPCRTVESGRVPPLPTTLLAIRPLVVGDPLANRGNLGTVCSAGLNARQKPGAQTGAQFARRFRNLSILKGASVSSAPH